VVVAVVELIAVRGDGQGGDGGNACSGK